MNEKPAKGLTGRIPMVGRKQELDRLHRYLHARGERHFIYYWAHGGLGKTRLLQELQQMVSEAGPGYYSTPIIDLYHTDTHSTSDVERAIVEGLDPDQKYFAHYRQERERYELLRERGTDPSVLEHRRETLAHFFVQGCREMALDARKLVICFDTVELLQYESSIVEEVAGLDTADTRIKPWLLDKLSELANVLVVFAGRPQLPAPGEQTDPQARLVTDMELAFGKDLTVVELQPFTLEETRSFIQELSGNVTIIPNQYVPIVHSLTGGRPIYLHLVVDLIRTLSPEPSRVLETFDQYAVLADAPEDDERLIEARDRIEVEILSSVFNEAAELGGYLARIALMPKGVDAEILHQSLGLPRDMALQLISDLWELSFTKHFKSLPGAERLHGERLFFHDEMYRLLTKPGVTPNLRLNERAVAHALVMNFYAPRIENLRQRIEEQPPEERIVLRERLQKLHVERLYYLLARDPSEGYEEYKRLSDQANRRRWVGYGMRLLDEFLRFYNTPRRRKEFEEARISYEHIVRESAQMWVERFHWWGQYQREIAFARCILEQPDLFFIRPDEDVAILGNICALWSRARAMLYGYEPEVLEKTKAILERMPPLVGCTTEEALARARLSTSVGYQLRRGGLLSQAADHYLDASAAFRKLSECQDELAILLNNLSIVYAEQGRMVLARPLAHEALRINEEMGNEYSIGLTLVILAAIARMRGNYAQAVAYGQEALDLFRQLEDAHGMTWAHLRIGYAKRKMAKHQIEKDRRLEETHQMLKEALDSVERALEIAEEAGLESNLPSLLAEQGRIYRELGRLVSRSDGREKGLVHYRQSERLLRSALAKPGWAIVDQANALQDLAEVLFLIGDQDAARQRLAQVEDLIGSEHRIVPGKHMPPQDLPTEHFAPLGKVETTRGQMAFSAGDFARSLQHYVLAYAYFARFSPEAIQKDTLIEYLYRRLHGLPLEEQQTLMQSLHGWLRQYDDLNAEVSSFVQTLEGLVGI